MRKVLLGAVCAVIALGLTADAYAFDDKCYPAVAGKGKPDDDEREAREKAIKAWHKAAEKKYGDDFADWWYSGERVISCKWNAKLIFTCTASARPCGRD